METLVAFIGAMALLAGGLLTYRASSRSTDHTRIKNLEDRVDKLERQNRLHWRYNRDLIDHIYRGLPPPPPPAPVGLAS